MTTIQTNMSKKYPTKQSSSNLLTRSIVGKPKGELTEADFDVAKRVVKEFIKIGVINDDLDLINFFQETHNWKVDELFVRCVEKHLKAITEKQIEYIIPGDKLKNSVQSNFYDLSIYFNLTGHRFIT